MRVIAGKVKGHHLKAPKRAATRPATDLVRGAIFSMLASMITEWGQVLDLFSGSGALGIEALSRGADWVDFVEKSRACCAIIKDNLEKTRLTEQARINCCSVARALAFLDKEYNIVLVDPPYSDQSIGKVISELATSRLIGEDSVVVVTHSPHLKLASAYPPLALTKEHRHGDSCIAIYQKEIQP